MRIVLNLNPSLGDVNIFIWLFRLSYHCGLSGPIRSDLLYGLSVPKRIMTDFKGVTQGQIQGKSSLGPIQRRAKRAEGSLGGPGVLLNFCDHTLKIGLKYYFRKGFFDHTLEVDTLKFSIL